MLERAVRLAHRLYHIFFLTKTQRLLLDNQDSLAASATRSTGDSCRLLLEVSFPARVIEKYFQTCSVEQAQKLHASCQAAMQELRSMLSATGDNHPPNST